MPYVAKRDEAGLFNKGDKLSYEKGELPQALKFSAVWQEHEKKSKATKKTTALYELERL